MVKLVMIPALCCDGDLYATLAEGLRDLVSIETVNPAAATFDGCVRQVLDAVDGDFIVMGTSFGGHVARETALAAPGRVKGLWIMGAGAGAVASPDAGIERVTKLRDGRQEEIYRGFAETITWLHGPRGKEAADAFYRMAQRCDPLDVALRAEALNARLDRWSDLSRIACPTLLLWGRHDRFSPPADGLHMAGLIPHSRYVEIPDCGHLPSLEAPDEVIDIASHWLKDSGLA
ncbi:MAG: alpha/beta fold hydrolase [Parvibaculaceae bacterium]